MKKLSLKNSDNLTALEDTTRMTEEELREYDAEYGYF